ETGILATNSVDAMVNTPADCVLYMRQGTDIDELCLLLASGKNVVTTRGDFHHPGSMDAGVRAKIEAACATGGTSIHSTGSSPGFVTEALAITLLSLSRRLDCLTIDEFADMASRNSPDLIFKVMGYGVPPGAFDPMKVEYVKHDFAASLAHVAEAAEIEIDKWQAFGENAAALEDTTIAAGLILKGTVAAQRITIEGLRNGQPVLRFRANWFCGRNINQPSWELRESGWRIKVEGDTPLDVSITFPVAPEDYAAFTPGLTGHRAVNAVPAVCGAAPGIRTTGDLPQVVARL
ncbi:dihydrodipicolinate reductase, partial [Novosphingobium sp.]|uniref:NAD(P)H-dependent amine dehydrogenase family protein n=1 Tax=Novosphingobium sp. TaxID=1874826 RepID=UPI0025DB7160